eukprot:gnl/MRDRNA2_/MRDRNA2_181034_c0_seq1.p1 gnl/MRDRNA2_/MRDRNA2_181034_c0~~gnl/MRDRNA2_/MRDRNA2_181034_c0_seq1.p1  ORF type:complete len:813 (-),score=176.76 gnl/MRDRNA2_/MRDRNA2_181034_c0_seq1:356-2527(-)
MSGGFALFVQSSDPGPRSTSRLKVECIETGVVGYMSGIRCNLLEPDAAVKTKAGIGPDPLRRDANPEKVWRYIESSHRAIGLVMMDQSIMSGVGNVYRAEILHRLRVHPLRPANTLSRHDFEALWNDCVLLLQLGARLGNIITVLDSEWSSAQQAQKARMTSKKDMLKRRWVYFRESCLECGEKVSCFALGSRICFACETCQPPWDTSSSLLSNGASYGKHGKQTSLKEKAKPIESTKEVQPAQKPQKRLPVRIDAKLAQAPKDDPKLEVQPSSISHQPPNIEALLSECGQPASSQEATPAEAPEQVTLGKTLKSEVEPSKTAKEDAELKDPQKNAKSNEAPKEEEQPAEIKSKVFRDSGPPDISQPLLEEVELRKMTAKNIRNLLSEYLLSSEGLKEEIVQRFLAHQEFHGRKLCMLLLETSPPEDLAWPRGDHAKQFAKLQCWRSPAIIHRWAQATGRRYGGWSGTIAGKDGEEINLEDAPPRHAAKQPRNSLEDAEGDKCARPTHKRRRSSLKDVESISLATPSVQPICKRVSNPPNASENSNLEVKSAPAPNCLSESSKDAGAHDLEAFHGKQLHRSVTDGVKDKRAAVQRRSQQKRCPSVLKNDAVDNTAAAVPRSRQKRPRSVKDSPGSSRKVDLTDSPPRTFRRLRRICEETPSPPKQCHDSSKNIEEVNPQNAAPRQIEKHHRFNVSLQKTGTVDLSDELGTGNRQMNVAIFTQQ